MTGKKNNSYYLFLPEISNKIFSFLDFEKDFKTGNNFLLCSKKYFFFHYHDCSRIIDKSFLRKILENISALPLKYFEKEKKKKKLFETIFNRHSEKFSFITYSCIKNILFNAIRNENLKIVKYAYSFDIEKKDNEYIFLESCKKGNLGIVEFLLKDRESSDKYYCIDKENVEDKKKNIHHPSFLELMNTDDVEEDENVEPYIKIGFVYSSQNGHLELVKKLFNKIYLLEYQSFNFCRFVFKAILYASENNHKEILKFLLDVGDSYIDGNADELFDMLIESKKINIPLLAYLLPRANKDVDDYMHNDYYSRKLAKKISEQEGWNKYSTI